MKDSSAIWLALRLATVSALVCAATAVVGDDLAQVRRQLARHAAGVLGGELGEGLGIGGERLAPRGFGRGAAACGVPVGIDLVGQDERRVRPAERGARQP